MNGWTRSLGGKTYTRGDFRIRKNGTDWILSHKAGAIEPEVFARPSLAMLHVFRLAQVNADEQFMGVKGNINQSRRFLGDILNAGTTR